METKQTILKLLAKKPCAGNELTSKLGISRQALHKHLISLINKGLIIRSGSTRSARYSLSGSESFKQQKAKSYRIKGLEEDKVFEHYNRFLNLSKNLSKSAFEIIRFAFTELLNNAIDHSGSEKCLIEFNLDNTTCSFQIRDKGIGIFESVRKKFKLADEEEAAVQILKGKTTTWAEKHTGQGIFFSSKAGETILFRSHRLGLTFDNRKNDIFFSDIKPVLSGTEVSFKILTNTRRSLRKIFDTYAPEEYDFDFQRTVVFVKLNTKDLISRSEAKRLIFGLEKFREVVLDFKKISTIGQGFTDEIFRVFLQQNPGIQIIAKNTSASVQIAIRSVVDKRNINRLTFG